MLALKCFEVSSSSYSLSLVTITNLKLYQTILEKALIGNLKTLSNHPKKNKFKQHMGGQDTRTCYTVVTTIIFLVIALILNSGRKRRMRIIRARMTPQGLKHGMDHDLLLKKKTPHFSL
jgi:hypothetical protein